MTVVSFEAAFAFRPTFTLTVAKREYTVLPLSLGRFLALTGPAAAKAGPGLLTAGTDLMQAMLGVLEGKEPSEEMMRALARVSPAALSPIVSAIVPEMDAKGWDDDGGILELLEVGRFLADAHDWDMIGEELGLSEQYATPIQKSVAAALTAFAKVAERPVEEILAMRLEGFFYHKRAYRELADEQGSPVVTPEAVGVVPQSDPEKKHPLWGALDEADGRADGN